MNKKKLNLGCGKDFKEGFVNLDNIKHDKKVDIVYNLNKIPWKPFKDNYFEHILAINVLEHIKQPFYKIMDELYRISKNGCIIEIVVPWYNSLSGHSINHYTHNFTFTTFYIVENKSASPWECKLRAKILELEYQPTLLGKLIPKIPIKYGVYKNIRDIFASTFGEVYSHIYIYA